MPLSPRIRALVALSLAASFFCLYLATSSVRGPFLGDSGEMLSAAVHLRQGGLGADPAGLTKYGLGQSLVDLPVAGAAAAHEGAAGWEKRMAALRVSAVGAAVGAGTVALTFLVALGLGASAAAALAAALLTGLTTLVWVGTQSLYAEPTVGLMWLLAVWGGLRARHGRRWGLAVAGGAAGFAGLCKVAFWPQAALIGLWALWARGPAEGGEDAAAVGGGEGAGAPARRGPLDLLIFTLPLALMVGAALAFNALRYGDPLAFGYSTGRDLSYGFGGSLWVGIYGMLLSSGKGLFFYDPTLVLAIPGGILLWRRRPRDVAVVAGLFALAHLTPARWWAWHGDWAWGPRFLAPAVPLLGALAAPALEAAAERWRGGRRLALAAVAGLAALGLAIQLSGILVERDAYLRHVLEDTTVTAGGPYHPQRWPMRDDLAMVHFIPELSPLVGHWWMMAVAGAPPGSPAQAQLLSAPPWASLNPSWVARAPPASRFFRDVWWLYMRQVEAEGWERGMSMGLALLTAAALALMGGLAALRLGRGG